MNTSTEVDEQQLEKAAREQAIIDELKEAPLVYEWTVNAPPFNVFIGYCIFVVLSSVSFGIWMALDKESLMPLLICSAFGCIMGSYLRYLCMPNKIYHYQLTPIGIRYTIQDAIPETAYQVVRAFAWVGVFVCIIAVGVLGPLALVGAGGMAFLAFGMTNFSSKIDEDWFYFVDDYEINILRKSNVFSMKNHPIKLYEFGYVYCEPGKLDEMLNRILPYLKNYTIKEIKSYRDL
ncbi:hypothetical protein Q9290_05375 [Oceanimonas sp. CHS3-5]|uniref:hypothetical protein n=1 Tax=Oceanimonas sp. CHS3-5 TaxID=3068186 RepID=UPI00273E1E17|nr:hypothetical protein [Oceanimonas sp. CHS3-5]MDP5291718.1 hypothetical protein [Oceanimonas sp. CHS3-5]